MESFLLFILYLFYGAAFFALGVAITARLKVFATLVVAGVFWILACFGYVHALHEWLELYLLLELADEQLWMMLRYLSLVLLLISFIFLYIFGINLHWFLNFKTWPYAGALAAASAIIFGYLYFSRGQDMQPYEIDYYMRLLFALPAALITGLGFIIYAKRIHDLSIKGAGSFLGAGVVFLAYGIFSGLIPSDMQIMYTPVQLWRGLCAYAILLFIMLALNRFLAERDEMMGRRLQKNAQFERLSSIGRLASGIAHEINNPLANASLQVELLQKNPGVAALPDSVQGQLQSIERSLEKSSHIAKELMGMAQEHSSAGIFSLVDMRQAVQRAWDGIKSSFPACSMSSHIKGTLLVPGMPAQIEHLFQNIFKNAAEAMPQGGSIHVYGKKQGNKVIFMVLDQGRGIDPQVFDRVLDPFFSTKEVGHGKGLGLSICYGIMKLHHGSIELSPRINQEGMMVTLVFPGKAEAFSGQEEPENSGRKR